MTDREEALESRALSGARELIVAPSPLGPFMPMGAFDRAPHRKQRPLAARWAVKEAWTVKLEATFACHSGARSRWGRAPPAWRFEGSSSSQATRKSRSEGLTYGTPSPGCRWL